jgi:dihydroxyacetone kinase-like protein
MNMAGNIGAFITALSFPYMVDWFGGAKAAMGADLNGVIAAAQKSIDNTRSVGVGLAPCTLPQVGHPNFEIEPGKMEMGIGHHGEPGIEIVDLETADKIAEKMTNLVVDDLPFSSGDDVVVLVSGLGATPYMEQYIYFNEVEKILTSKKINIHKSYVGDYFTSLDMQGITLTILKLDNELKDCIDYECNSIALKQFAK